MDSRFRGNDGPWASFIMADAMALHDCWGEA